MPFGRHASLAARSDGPYGQRQLLIENVGGHTATAITIAFEGQQGGVELLAGPVAERIAAGETVRLPLRRARPGAVFRLALTWQTRAVSRGGSLGY